jgi:hypothetical protein
MPAVSKKQQRYFGYLLSNPEERKKKGISKKAAKDFAQDVKEEKKSCPEGQYYCFDMGKCRPIPKGKKVRADGELVSEVAPPGWGHTKAEKEKTKPWKPKSKIGGSAAAFKKDLESGKFKGLPGSKTKKEKTADMFKIMWAAKKKGYKPHYKPGTDKKYKKYQKEDWKPEIEVVDTKARAKKAEKKRKEAESSLPPHLKLDVMKKAFASESTMPNVDPKDRKVIKARAKTLFKKDLNGEVRGVNEAVKGQDTESRKEGAKERATEKRAHDAWKKRPGTTKRPLYSTTRHTKKVGDDYATQQKQSIKWHDQRTKGKFIPGTTTNEGKTWKDFKRTIDTVRGKKQEMPKPKKADDAGARARRAMQRKEYKSKVSVIVPPELED